MAAWKAPVLPLPAIAAALGVSLSAESYPVFQTAVGLCEAEQHGTPLMQQAVNALGVRKCGLAFPTVKNKDGMPVAAALAVHSGHERFQVDLEP